MNGRSYYRIEAVDKDGKTTYSKTMQTTLNIKPETLNIFPNPARNVVNVIGKNIQQINIIDFTGRILIQKNYNNSNNVQLNIENLSKGIYLLKVVDVKGNIQTKKLIVE
ncbi:MAG: T9SS type A sorting domain-containing protein [Chitinophagaceae bacterium]|nr:T9SS type A sorting domain-containing protein [Chitinophagaceae bacterium]MCW5904224.1 T9SS type A sorting domain-containing protein [Chitinophagaceae bacterium]